jgi:hypothetical protein
MTWHPVVIQGEPQQAEQSLVSDYCRAEWKQVRRLRELYEMVLNDGFHGASAAAEATSKAGHR